jgi:hypothetical protein
MLKYFALLLTALFVFQNDNIQAQSDEEVAIKALIERRAELINLAKSTPRITDLLKLHTSAFRSMSAIYTPDGEVQRTDADMAMLKRVLSNYSDAGDQQYVTSLKNIAYSQIYERSAVVIYSTEYKMINAETKKVLYGGDQIVTANLKNTADGWKFHDMYVTEIRSTVNRYPCPYELYQKDANELLVSVKVPAGSQFKNEYIDIRFTETNGGAYIIQTDKGDEFTWENNVLRATISNGSAAIADRPNSKTGVCESIIMYYNRAVCSAVVKQK